jgi:superfamily II DNA or RNA helicase
MMLRQWQSECVGQALAKYKAKKRHFLCLATPGAGKTIMAAEVAALLFEQDLIDFVLCFSPSIVIANEIRRTLESRMNTRFDGIIGAKGGSFTYQSMQFLNPELWRLIKSHRVFVIFDEIHHCAGSSITDANSWGEKVIANIQHDAAYTLTLTGTPWRSDHAPIALAEYHSEDRKIVCDYTYGLAHAIRDNVCRVPRIVITDNDNISLQQTDGELEKFSSFTQLLDQTLCPYQRIVENETVIRHLLSQASNKLTEIRQVNPDAGGLVVASSVNHALKILSIIENELHESAVIATYKENDPATIIDDFKANTTRWIVSVGMISEGTNLPRLQVCCHLTRIKTELHFRQILGRILRINNSENQEAYLFMPAESTLIDYAHRVAEDIPEENAIVRVEKSASGISINDRDKSLNNEEWVDCDDSLVFGEPGQSLTTDTSPQSGKGASLTQTYEAMLNVSGRFKQDILALSISPFEELI